MISYLGDRLTIIILTLREHSCERNETLFEKIQWFSQSHLHDITLVILSTIFGIFAGPVVESIAPPLFSSDNVPNVVFIITTICMIILTVYSGNLWKSTQNTSQHIASEIQKISQVLGKEARLAPYREAYRIGAEWISNAKKEIRIVTFYEFDWDNFVDNYDPDRLSSPERTVWFDALYEAIRRTQSTDLRFVRIVQIPAGQSFLKALEHDALFHRDCKLLVEIGKKHPESASLRLSDIYISNTFVLIDGTHLYLEFDIQDPDTHLFSAPFVLLATDSSGKNFKDLLRLHQRLEAKSRLLVNLEE